MRARAYIRSGRRCRIRTASCPTRTIVSSSGPISGSTRFQSFSSMSALARSPKQPTHQSGAGAGPRHLTFHPNGRFVYVLNELGSTVAVYTYDDSTGAMVQVQVTPLSPGGKEPENHRADLHISSSGNVLLCVQSWRRHDCGVLD